MSINLNKDQKISLTKDNEGLSKIAVGLGWDEYTQKKKEKKLGISRSYVSRIEKRALTKILREFIKDKQYEIDN